ncbi:MAG TPA: hypothetical protein VK468_07150, partial [Pyrinomonadaceae bacterium]|nr:hypothetical protein [Pyrinomonadaceae bacterium]
RNMSRLIKHRDDAASEWRSFLSKRSDLSPEILSYSVDLSDRVSDTASAGFLRDLLQLSQGRDTGMNHSNKNARAA